MDPKSQSLISWEFLWLTKRWPIDFATVARAPWTRCMRTWYQHWDPIGLNKIWRKIQTGPSPQIIIYVSCRTAWLMDVGGIYFIYSRMLILKTCSTWYGPSALISEGLGMSRVKEARKSSKKEALHSSSTLKQFVVGKAKHRLVKFICWSTMICEVFTLDPNWIFRSKIRHVHPIDSKPSPGQLQDWSGRWWYSPCWKHTEPPDSCLQYPHTILGKRTFQLYLDIIYPRLLRWNPSFNFSLGNAMSNRHSIESLRDIFFVAQPLFIESLPG